MLEIEIVDSNIIEGGVEVFARAWRDGAQLGFGADGTVDVERFRIFNPPVLVRDDDGDITVLAQGNDIITTLTTTYREDPEEALLQALEHVIKKVGKSGENIVVGKTGNTTSTFYSSYDGVIGSRNASFATFISGSDLSVDTTSAILARYVGVGVYYQTSGSSYQGDKAHLQFDTSAIDTDTISTATLSLYPYPSEIHNDDNSGDDYLVVMSSTIADDSLTTGDWTSHGSTEFSDQVDLGSLTASVYNDFTINASGISEIDGSGTTKFSLREGDEIAEVAPSLSNGEANRVIFYAVDQAGTTNDPKLVVEHSAAAANEVASVAGISNTS